jgi:small subunit ribosomal protein S1
VRARQHAATAATTNMMKETVKNTNLLNPPKVGEIVKGTVIAQERSSLYLDLGAIGTGIVYGREFYEIKERIKDLNVGDPLSVKIINLENDEGYIELSVSGATNELVWDSLKNKKDNKESLTIKVLGANKGGLITKISGLAAFLPVSQLTSEHYPKIMGGDPEKILKELQKFIGTDLNVRILNLKPKTGEIILSEKLGEMEMREEGLKKYNIDDQVDCDITGVMEFGVFVKFGKESFEGLIPVSQISSEQTKNLSEHFRINDKIKARIIEIANNKVFLSLKDLS